MREYFNDTYKIFLYTICILIILLYPMPYYISSGGGISDLNEKISVKDGYKSKGSFNLSYVTQMDANFSSYVMSYVMPNWEREKADDYKYTINESIEDINNRGKLSLTRANQTSIFLAYKKANKNIKIIDTNYYIFMINNPKIKDLKVGDKLVSVNNINISNFDEVKTIIANSDSVSVKVKRKDKEIEENIDVIETNNEILIGLAFQEVYNYETDPKI